MSDPRAAAGITAESLAPVRRPTLLRMPEERARAFREDVAALGLAVQPPRATPEGLENRAYAVFRATDGHIVATQWRDGLAEIADPARHGAFDILGIERAADSHGLTGGPRLDYVSRRIAEALGGEGVAGGVLVERWADAGAAPTWRDYLEGRLFVDADYRAGRRAMTVTPPDPAETGTGPLSRLYILNEVAWEG